MNRRYTNEQVSGIAIEALRELAGKDFVLCQLASDTPMYQLALNFPLVDVTAENGPLEIIRGTHMMTKEEGMDLLESGKAKIEAISMQMGDVMIRVVRTPHRGTPNKTEEPRPMVVIGYSRSWLNRPEVSITIPRAEYENLSDFVKNMLRTNPVTDELNFFTEG